MLCPNCGKPTEEAFAALCPECKEIKEQAKREAAEKLRIEQEKKRAMGKPVAAIAASALPPVKDPSEKREGPAKLTEPAGFWIRVMAYYIDHLINSAIFCAGLYTVIVIFGASTLSLGFLLQDEFNQFLPQIGILGLVLVATSLLFVLLLPVAMESSPWQATFGKKFLGLVVVDENHQRASFMRCLARAVVRFLSFIPMSLPLLVVAFHNEKKAIHDMAAGTKVMKTEDTSWLRICWVIMFFLVSLLLSTFIFEAKMNQINNPQSSSTTSQIGIDENYSAEEVPQLGNYTLERYQKLTLKLNSSIPMKLSYTHPKNFDNSRCKDTCAKISVLGESGKTTTEWIGLNKAGLANPVGNSIAVELQNLTDRPLEVVLHGEILD